MLLEALYEYGKSHTSCSVPAGCTLKSVKGIVRLTSDGQYVGVSAREKGAPGVVCPSIFTKAQAAGRCDPFAVNSSIILGLDCPDNNIEKWRNKRPCFLQYWEGLKKANPDGEAVLKALTNDETLQQISKGLAENKIKPIDMVAFAVDERMTCDDERTLSFWQKHNTQDSKDDDIPPEEYPDRFGLDMISGESCELAEVLHKTKGLSSVGGMGSGDALTCFDKDSFLSYGLKKYQVAPMGKESSDLVVDALNVLVAQAPQIAGTKFVHWYKSDIPSKNDIINILLDIPDDDNDDDDGENTGKERNALIRAKAVFDSIKSGENSGILSLNNAYYILLLSAYSGRVMIRKYEEGSFDDLVRNVHSWYADTSIVNSAGIGENRHYNIGTMLLGIIEQKDSNKVFEQVGKEFAGSLPSVMEAIIHGKQIPTQVVQKTLLRIKSDVLSSGGDKDSQDKKKLPQLNARALQWLIAYIRRNERKNKEEYIMAELNPNHPNPAYHCGRLLAIYGDIQMVASGGRVGTTVVERFYSKMSSAPAKTIDKLDALSVHHLAKIDSGLNPILQSMLNDAYASLGDTVPDALNMTDRAYFALGYHQQLAAIRKRKIEASAQKAKDKETAEASEKSSAQNE